MRTGDVNLSRRPILAGNWKMHLGLVDQARAFTREILPGLNELSGADIVLAPPFTVLTEIAGLLQPSPVYLAAQNLHWEAQGAHTGEISPEFIGEFCQFVIIGHSERRATKSLEESDESIHRKTLAALASGMYPIICVGEDSAQNDAGETHEFVGSQVRRALVGVPADQIPNCVVAYEPIWAIGSGKAATPADANRVIGLTVRGAIAEVFDEQIAAQVRVQYGGSVNPENIAEFMAMPDIDGALVGGASLKPSFVDLVSNAIVG
jgi:triosephosphate isomerase